MFNPCIDFSSKTLAEDDWLSLNAVKAMIDGSLGSHTAAMIDEYCDCPKDKGHLIWDKDMLQTHLVQADKLGLQAMVHAIGDLAIKEILQIFTNVADINGRDIRERRFRIEHAQHIADEDIAVFAEKGIIASMQPSHMSDDGRWARTLLGPNRIHQAWPIASLLDKGCCLAFGSDWFVTDPSPLDGIWSAVSRKTILGQDFGPEQKISVEEALKAYTVNAA